MPTQNIQNLVVNDGELVLDGVLFEDSFHKSLVKLVEDGYLLTNPVVDRVDAGRITGDRWVSTQKSTFVVPIIAAENSKGEKRYLLQLPNNSEHGIYTASRRRS